MENLDRIFNIEKNKKWMTFGVYEMDANTSTIERTCKAMNVETRIVNMEGDVEGVHAKLKALELYTIDVVFGEMVKLVIMNALLLQEEEE